MFPGTFTGSLFEAMLAQNWRQGGSKGVFYGGSKGVFYGDDAGHTRGQHVVPFSSFKRTWVSSCDILVVRKCANFMFRTLKKVFSDYPRLVIGSEKTIGRQLTNWLVYGS